jgi:[ribosomal protein S18]-alanine N-acetyltransferase
MSARPETLYQLLPMHPSHLAWAVDIEQRSHEFPWSEGIFQDCLNAGYSAWVLCNTLGEVVAYALMSMGVGEAHVLNVSVDPEHRRRGLGRVLMEHLMVLARHSGCEIMLLEVRASNTAALGMYRALGFGLLYRRKRYYPARQDREDALVMGLDLTTDAV